MGNEAYEDDELYGEPEEGVEDERYDPPQEITPELVAAIPQMKSLGHLEDLNYQIDENVRVLYARERARINVQRLENLKRAHSAPRCQHIKPDGDTCRSPAVTGQTYCHFHAQAYASASLQIPMIEDNRSFQVAMMRVCQQIANGTLAPAQAKVLIEALTIASKNAGSLGLDR